MHKKTAEKAKCKAFRKKVDKVRPCVRLDDVSCNHAHARPTTTNRTNLLALCVRDCQLCVSVCVSACVCTSAWVQVCVLACVQVCVCVSALYRWLAGRLCRCCRHGVNGQAVYETEDFSFTPNRNNHKPAVLSAPPSESATVSRICCENECCVWIVRVGVCLCVCVCVCVCVVRLCVRACECTCVFGTSSGSTRESYRPRRRELAPGPL